VPLDPKLNELEDNKNLKLESPVAAKPPDAAAVLVAFLPERTLGTIKLFVTDDVGTE
jgi:hypothetical protein